MKYKLLYDTPGNLTEEQKSNDTILYSYKLDGSLDTIKPKQDYSHIYDVFGKGEGEIVPMKEMKEWITIKNKSNLYFRLSERTFFVTTKNKYFPIKKIRYSYTKSGLIREIIVSNNKDHIERHFLFKYTYYK